MGKPAIPGTFSFAIVGERKDGIEGRKSGQKYQKIGIKFVVDIVFWLWYIMSH